MLPAAVPHRRAHGRRVLALYSGAVLNFVENPETVPENVREIAPTVFTAVPRVWEKFYSGVLIAPEGGGRAAAAGLRVAIGIGYRQAKLREERKPVPAGLALAFWLARAAGARTTCAS